MSKILNRFLNSFGIHSQEKVGISYNHNNSDATKESAQHLLMDRLPWLFLGLLVGILVTIVVSSYEKILKADIRLAFFMPVIVYLSDAVGTQTEAILIRTLARKKINFIKYIIKESFVGVGLGLFFGLLLGLFAFFWLSSFKIALTIGFAMFINLTIAPILAVLIPFILYKDYNDPALGAGPVATVVQDLISLIVYFFIASLIIF